MYYCSHCHLANETACCRVCGKESLPEISGSDFCYLTTQSAPWAQMLREVLETNGVACMLRPVHGAWLVAYFGSVMEQTEFFVPYEKLALAQSLTDELFAAEPAGETEE